MCEVWWESVLITIFTPCCFGQAQMAVAEVEAVGIGIQFHGDLLSGQRLSARRRMSKA